MRIILQLGFAVGLAACAVYPAAAQTNAAGAGQAGSILREAVADSVAANAFWKRLSGMARDSARLGEVPSAVVPGLIYHRVRFTPPRTSHVGPFTSIGISKGGEARILNTVQDWSAVAQWAPRSANEAATACAELVEALAFGPTYGRVFRSRRDIRYVIPETGQAVLQRRAQKPRAARSTDGRWIATVWHVTSGRTLQRQCTYLAAGVAPVVTTVDSIPAGYFTGH